MNEFILSFIVDDATLNTYMNEMEYDQLLAEAAIDGEHQLTFQEQMGGSVTSREPGRFEFNQSHLAKAGALNISPLDAFLLQCE